MVVLDVRPKHEVAVVSLDDGESSIASTVTVVNTSVEVVLAKEQGKKPNYERSQADKKRVQFDEERNKAYSNRRFSKKDTQSLWYSSKDYRQFKAGTKCMAREIARFEKINQAPHSYERVMQRAYQACIEHQTELSENADNNDSHRTVLSKDEQKHMKKWMEISTNRLGCERLSIHLIAKDRALRRAEASHAVLQLQELASDVAKDDAHSNNYSNYKAELIRQSCMAITRPSRLFAQSLAQAQHESLKCEQAPCA